MPRKDSSLDRNMAANHSGDKAPFKAGPQYAPQILFLQACVAKYCQALRIFCVHALNLPWWIFSACCESKIVKTMNNGMCNELDQALGASRAISKDVQCLREGGREGGRERDEKGR
jgi:hypothetical protein